jgi:ribosome-associated protein
MEAITQKKPAVRQRATAKRSAERLPSDLLKIVEKSLDADKAEDIISIDLTGKSTIADYMVIATGRSNRQLASMAQHLDEKLAKSGIKQVSIEGLTQGEWVLLDGGDVIVHLFKPETRRFYNLEKMWGVALPEPERMIAVG